MAEISDVLASFTFLELLFLTSIGLLILIALFSSIRFSKLKEKKLLLFRHIAGFIVGLIDQTCMVLFNFQPKFLAIVVLFDYTAYCLWFMFMPNFETKEKKKMLMIFWITFSATFNTIFEHISLIFLTGGLNYPIEPIIWTTIHTIIFYLTMHSIGVILVSIGFKYLKE
ncbi:MAG: hypothetical protein ACTSR8_12175 [Promethearchaeota archaeon]